MACGQTGKNKKKMNRSWMDRSAIDGELGARQYRRPQWEATCSMIK